MGIKVVDNPGQSRFEAFADGDLAGFAVYGRHGDEIAFVHTEVGDAFEGQGVGSQLAAAALDDARERGLKVLPFCPFIRSYIAKHDGYLDLVPEDQREKFGL